MAWLKLRLKIYPDQPSHSVLISPTAEAYELLEKAARESDTAVEDFALFCVYSCLAGYASEIEVDTSQPSNFEADQPRAEFRVSPGDGDPDYTLRALDLRGMAFTDLTP